MIAPLLWLLFWLLCAVFMIAVMLLLQRLADTLTRIARCLARIEMRYEHTTGFAIYEGPNGALVSAAIGAKVEWRADGAITVTPRTPPERSGPPDVVIARS
jgi:hypothetical protein